MSTSPQEPETVPLSPHDDLESLQERVVEASAWTTAIIHEMSGMVVGQQYLIRRLLIGLLGNGHVLLEGVPGLAKTTTIKALSGCLRASFSRIQFTPDLLPSDIVGNLIYNPQEHRYFSKRGPIFANLLLADEINRAPAKVQSALLEAMQERQVTLGDETLPLPDPFLVLATQNPVEQDGTYPLPEAQVDRFMLKVEVGYGSDEEELQILKMMASSRPKANVRPVMDMPTLVQLRELTDQIYIDENIMRYIVALVSASRRPESVDPGLSGLIRYGASPRATINLALASRAHAFLSGRAHVTPLDVRSIAFDVLSHRILRTYEASAEGLTGAHIVERILEKVPVP